MRSIQTLPNRSLLSHKTVLLGITGGIAAYKSCDLIRRLKEVQVNVHVVMTSAAEQFITPLTLQALSENPVHKDLFSLEEESKINHIQLADMADLIIIAPASADFIAKFAYGISDNLLLTVLCASKAPVFICPSMNVNMWQNAQTQENILKLKKRGVYVVEPNSGLMACGHIGPGRLPETSEIIEAILKKLAEQSPLFGKKVLITTGSTREHLDPVRYISSPASGKTGFALAEAAQILGAEVTLISGPTHLKPISNIEYISVISAEEMFESAKAKFEQSDYFISAAAVSDFRPKNVHSQKVKKENAITNIELVANPDILKELSLIKKHQILIGFAAETENLEENALKKLKYKNLDYLIANSVDHKGKGFASDVNEWIIYKKNGEKKIIPNQSKYDLAHELFQILIQT